MSLLGSVLSGLFDLVAPRLCPGCEAPESGAGHEDGFCGACRPLLEPAVRADVAFVYGGPLADAIRRLKYAGRSELAPVLGALFAGRAAPLLGRADVVVPVPLHPARLRARGYDQAALLSVPLAARLGIPLRPQLLERGRPTQVQASLPRAARVGNVKGAFVARRVEGLRVLLADDVRTTGATLAEAGGALLAAGAVSVVPFALAGVDAGEDERLGAP